MRHPRVPHPRELQHEKVYRSRLADRNDQLLSWLTEHLLASIAMFDAALVLPLLALPLSSGIKLTLGVISGSWFQWWALPALQRAQIKADAKRDAKADADHQALTHIAHQVDRILDQLGTGCEPSQR